MDVTFGAVFFQSLKVIDVFLSQPKSSAASFVKVKPMSGIPSHFITSH
jgi:hypothetical protein